MTMHDFNNLDEIEQMSAIMQLGSLVAENTEGEKRIFLYHIETFYVAASYFHANDQLSDIKCYLEINQLIPHHRKQLHTVNPAERV
jgi:hypothetical protein